MRLLIQRVSSGSVSISGRQISKIGKGYVILLGVGKTDTEKEVKLLAEKTVNLRVMSDSQGKMNKSILDAGGEILVISQFTLYADTTGGRRPSFLPAAEPMTAQKLYLSFIGKLKQLGVKNVQKGRFGEYMSVEILNDGPVTILLNTEDLTKK